MAKQTATQVAHHRSSANSERALSIVVRYGFSYARRQNAIFAQISPAVERDRPQNRMQIIE